MKPFFYLDTNVYRLLADNTNNTAVDLNEHHRLKIRLSAITLIELIEDLLTCSPRKFGLHKRAIELARQIGGAKIVAAPGEFLAKHLFKTSYANPHLAVTNLKRWLDFAVRQKHQAGLSSPVRVGIFEYYLDVSLIAHYQEIWRSHYISRTKSYIEAVVAALGSQSRETRGGPLRGASAKAMQVFLESQQWKRLYVRKLAGLVQRESLDDETLDRMYPYLEAACKFVSTILRQSLCEGYRFERHANDAVDEAQLHYLCDPSLTFVTNDGRLRDKILACDQSKRVISIDDFITRLERAA